MKILKKICLLFIGTICIAKVQAQTEATFYTNMGSFRTVLADTLTPITVDSFISRVAMKFYDGTIFHRVIDNFVIQGGDPLGTGFGGPGYETPDEFDPSLKNVAGSLAMANSGPNTNGSQFYVNLVDNDFLDGGYTVFGMVDTNFIVVQNIGHVPTDSNDKPIANVVLDSVRITQLPTFVSTAAGKIGAYIYPNPCRGQFNIDVPAGIETMVEIVSTTGQVVYTTTTKEKLKVDFHTKAAGLYVVRLRNARGFAENKLVVQ